MPRIQLGKYTKAIGAAAAAGYATYQFADADHVIVGWEWRAIIVTTLVTGVITWAVPNTKDPDAGAS